MPDESQFARGTERDAFGKLDDSIEVRVPGDVKIMLEDRARDAGMGLPEYIRTNWYVLCFGLDHVLSVKQERIRRAVGNVGAMTDKAGAV